MTLTISDLLAQYSQWERQYDAAKSHLYDPKLHNEALNCMNMAHVRMREIRREILEPKSVFCRKNY